MLENIQFFSVVIFAYCWPLIMAVIFVYIYRTYIDKGSNSRDFISGLIYLVGARETLKNFMCKKRR